MAQAIARVNRPYPDKESGLIVDYIGVFEDLQRALAFDNATISKGLINHEKLRAVREPATVSPGLDCAHQPVGR